TGKMAAVGVAARTKKKKQKSLFPLTSNQENRGKMAAYADLTRLAEALYAGERTEKVGESSSGDAGSHLGLYMDRRAAFRLLKEEGEHHRDIGNVDYEVWLEIWKGNVGGALKIASDNNSLNDYLVALSAQGKCRAGRISQVGGDDPAFNNRAATGSGDDPAFNNRAATVCAADGETGDEKSRERNGEDKADDATVSPPGDGVFKLSVSSVVLTESNIGWKLTLDDDESEEGSTVQCYRAGHADGRGGGSVGGAESVGGEAIAKTIDAAATSGGEWSGESASASTMVPVLELVETEEHLVASPETSPIGPQFFGDAVCDHQVEPVTCEHLPAKETSARPIGFFDDAVSDHQVVLAQLEKMAAALLDSVDSQSECMSSDDIHRGDLTWKPDVETTSEVVIPVNVRSEVVTLVDTTSEVVIPVNVRSEVVTLVDTTSEVMTPVNVRSEVVNSVDTTSEVMTPVNVRSEVVNSVDTTSEVMPPVNVRSEVVNSVDSTSEVVPPVNVRSEVVNSVDSTSEVVLSRGYRSWRDQSCGDKEKGLISEEKEALGTLDEEETASGTATVKSGSNSARQSSSRKPPPLPNREESVTMLLTYLRQALPSCAEREALVQRITTWGQHRPVNEIT
ncbi:PREDICTED: probable GPI-anchored adhesin-like protein PGA55, partial [Priapulus caudatus]|uniref:Probable GPI-anchored adhesin-like protein PGA55 n=1 Tax=Priapulus caudatus TaxID=37621 RepID=A0ABM1ERK9_PRICU